jgi:serine/threonine protein kinase
MLKEKVTNSQNEATADILQAKKRLLMDHPYIQKMFDYSCHSKSEFCSKFFKVRGFYELPTNDLKKEIGVRKKNLQEFNHEELTHMGYQCLSALEYLQTQGTPFCDLKPAHISVDNSTQTYKLLDRLNDPSPIV